VQTNSVNQPLFAPLVIVRITNICFCIYSVTAWVHTVLKAKVHRVQTSGDSKMYLTIHEITITVTITNENYTFIAITRRYLLYPTTSWAIKRRLLTRGTDVIVYVSQLWIRRGRAFLKVLHHARDSLKKRSYMTEKLHKTPPSVHHCTTLSGYMFATKAVVPC